MNNQLSMCSIIKLLNWDSSVSPIFLWRKPKNKILKISMNRFKLICSAFLILVSLSIHGQEEDKDALFIKSIYDYTLTEGDCYQWLYDMTTQIGGRLAGSMGADRSVEFTKDILDTLGVDKVWLQECEVPHWVRGEPEMVKIVNGKELKAVALGGSIGTGKEGLTAEVIEVLELDELEKLGESKIKGKIVFFNRPMDPTQIRTFNAYGGAVDQRVWGAARAVKFGAVGVLVRSMSLRQDNVPHTGSMVYDEGGEKIPGLAISTNDANHLSNELKKGNVEVYMRNTSMNLPSKTSHSVIAEIKGSEFPEEIILVGGHLDSWDIGAGAHDDGAGCVHSMQVIQTLIDLNYKPKRTLRCVLFMNEENGLKGGLAYADSSNTKNEFHIAAIESDAGGFTPRGFSCDAENEVFAHYFRQILEWQNLLEPYGLYFTKGGSGADISPLKSQKGILIGFRPDSQRYFDYHHTSIDNIQAVNKRELELGAAAITSLVYLIDKNGLTSEEN